MAKKYTEIGSLNQAEAKEGQSKGDLYLKIFLKSDQRISLKSGDTIRLEDPKAKFDRMLDKGAITQEIYEQRTSQLPSYIKKTAVLVQEE